MSRKRDILTELYYRHYAVVFNSVYLKVNSIDDTEDICQEIFIRLYNKLDEIESVPKWLFGTLKLVVFEYYRKKDPRMSDITEIFNDIALTFVNGTREARIIIGEVIDETGEQLNEVDRMVFELIAYYSYTYKETARQLGITLRMAEYKYKKIVSIIIDQLRKRGINSLEELL